MQNDGNSLNLIDVIDTKVELVRTKSLDLSFNEILDMYVDGEFIIDPSYQRLFRWSEEKQSQFIESLLLEMPIPPIYVIEVQESVYELIDGLQRISSYLHFRGALEKLDEECTNEDTTEDINEEIIDIQRELDALDEVDDLESGKFLKLTGCDIVEELNGHNYNDLPKTLQIRLKRSFVRVEVIRKGSDPRFRYYMFKRLNTGGEKLSDQEVRNCIIRLLDDKFNDFIIHMSQNSHFRNTIKHLNTERIDKKEDQEYVLKYFAYKLDRQNYRKDVGPFLTKFMEKVSDTNHPDNIPFNYELEKEQFEKVFKILDLTLGEHAFDKKRAGNYVSGITSTHFDAFTIGLLEHLDKINLSDSTQLDNLKVILEDAKSNPEFLASASAGGKNTRNYLAKRIEVIQSLVGEFLNGQS